MKKMTVDLKVGETMKIGSATVRLESKSGKLARLTVLADPETLITTPNQARMSALQSTPKGAP